MAIESPHTSGVALQLNAGTRESTGAMIVRSCSLGKMVYQADSGKVMSIVGVLLPILVHSLYRVRRTEVTILEN